MQTISQEALMHICVNFIFFFVIGSFGAFLKDLYETLTKKNSSIRFGEVLIGGACAAFIILGLQDNWLKEYSLNVLVFLTFIGGILGFELFGNITTIAKLRKTLQMISDIKDVIVNGGLKPEKNDEDNNKKTKK